jgi:exopolysaccharide biosynthesis polyprenyl glycosylphosphotransferase
MSENRMPFLATPTHDRQAGRHSRIADGSVTDATEPRTFSGVPTRTAPRRLTADWARQYRVLLGLSDSLVIIAAVGVAYVLRNSIAGDGGLAPLPTASAALLALIAVSWALALAVYRTRDSRVVGVGTIEYKRIISASALAFGLLGIAFLIAQVHEARAFFVIALPTGVAGLLGSRWLWRRWLVRQRSYERYLSRALVVGDAEDVASVVHQIQTGSSRAFKVVGAAVDGPPTGAVVTDREPVPIVADLDGVPRAMQSIDADTVIVAGRPRGGASYIRRLSWQLEGTETDLVLAAPLTDVAGPRVHFYPVEGLPLIHVAIPQFEGTKHIVKRAFDIGASAAALLLLLPLMLVVAVAIKLDDHGPVLFRQERVGRGGERFRMLKFRSMVPTAEQDLAALTAKNEAAGLLFKIKDDPRITRVGRVLRKYSLDELPQFWNIFIGQMSLVGPRPPLQSEVEAYADHVRRRLYIKPGLTGMWQVSGRSDLSWEESVRLDLYYVENWSLTGDIIILWRTVRTVLHPVGAY